MDGYAFIPSTSSSSSTSNVVYTSKDFHYCLKKKKKDLGGFLQFLWGGWKGLGGVLGESNQSPED